MSILQEVPPRSRLLLHDNVQQEVLYDVTKEEEKNASPDESYERSAALERVYVHEVYENCEDYNTSTVRSKVVQFLSTLEPGSIICDVGCGNGGYLASSYNPSIFSLGVERSFRLAKSARNSSIEVALCDNLQLPFRDESFDAILSLSVIHHFATTERRVKAIRELTRVLKVGGKVVISVWAFEQKSRRFDGNSSQDVLIPWQSPQIKNIETSDEEEDEFLAPYHAYNSYNYTEDSIHSNSSRSIGDGDSSSISSSSSPNDTCYSFVRRALQKLAGGKKSPWFLDSWTSRDMQKENSLERDEDAKDLPIELRKLDNYDYSTVGVKSRSLGSILLYPPQKQIVRSLSSVPSLGGTALKHGENSCEHLTAMRESTKKTNRPKLIKQKQSIADDEELIYHEHATRCDDIKSQFLRKQSSLNEELMAESRIREKERIRKKIQKQYSLNESFLYRSILAKRLQVIREGFTTRFKKSTGSLERLTKTSFVKIIKNIKTANSTSSSTDYPYSESREPIFTENSNLTRSQDDPCVEKSSRTLKGELVGKVRRERSGSDSSKESSLQSDTSIESEDSFASVIHNPNPRSSLVPTSPLALSIQSPTSKIQCNQKDIVNFSFETDKKDPFDEVVKRDEKVACKSEEKVITQSLKFPISKDLQEIPKFKRKISNFPIVKRLPSSNSTKNIIVPKFVSLEIFNPEIDDSDSSDDDEPSSPDSIDSVINISSTDATVVEECENKEEVTHCDTEELLPSEPNETSTVNKIEEFLTDDDESPPLSAKIQSHITQNMQLAQISKRQHYQYQQQQQKVNDFILEENEDTEDEGIGTQINKLISCQATNKSLEQDTTCLLHEESFDESDAVKRPLLRNIKAHTIRLNENNESFNNSQENSNSTTASLDSPSIGGGSATHHVFHHIFRQNELDELINKHIGNLHIVSSFYEKQSWCVVCEKVQVWTI